MNEFTNELNIENKIHEIRGKQVMLDSDLATLYQCSNGTKTINQAVSRHNDRFPDDFYFQLTETETNTLWSQLGTANNKSRSLPYAFTEQGVAMLATVLRTPIAASMSIKIMRAFVAMRKYISSNLLEQKYINNLVMKHEEDINKLLSILETKNQKYELFFDGQIYDAYSKIVDILAVAKKI